MEEFAVNIHVDWSGNKKPIDWSPLSGRPVIFYPEQANASTVDHEKTPIFNRQEEN